MAQRLAQVAGLTLSEVDEQLRLERGWPTCSQNSNACTTRWCTRRPKSMWGPQSAHDQDITLEAGRSGMSHPLVGDGINLDKLTTPSQRLACDPTNTRALLNQISLAER